MIDLPKEDEKLFALVGACSVMSFFVPPHSRNSSNFFTLFPPCIPIGVLVVKRSFSKSEKQKELPTKHLFLLLPEVLFSSYLLIFISYLQTAPQPS